MDICMHYYGTYALARAAGISEAAAHRIATAAEFVDDSTDAEVIVNPNGARFRGESTAHHPLDFAPNNDRDDQLTVWVPFHFLPGAEGTNQSQKLVCRKNSAIAQEMVRHHLDLADKPFAAELMGITAHVYSDTFAHYGFSGVSSRVNRVVGNAIELINGDPLKGTLERFMGKFGTQGGLLKNFRTAISAAAEDTTGALGHGAVATYPDQPYLEWSYSYEAADLVAPPVKIERQNVNDYMEAAALLHEMFRKFAAARPQFADGTGGRDFEKISPTIRNIVALIAPTPDRIAAWKKALADGKLTKNPDNSLQDYDHNPWRSQTNQLGTLEDPQMASGLPAYHFHQAAALHKYYVLRDLLPRHGIYVI